MRLYRSWLIVALLLAALPARAAPDLSAEIARLQPLAEKGDAAAQYRVGLLYAESQNPGEAARYYRLSAAQGNASAQKSLARLGVEPAPSPAAAQPPRTVAPSTLTVTLRRQSGVLMVPAVLNDVVSANFVVDSGASDVVIPENL